jgi:hypothetical protein
VKDADLTREPTNMARDREVRNAIQTALIQTGAFDFIWMWGMPEDYGSGSSNLAVAAIEPSSSDQLDRWDYAPAGGLLVSSRVNIVLLYRHEDPQLRDEAVELLFDVAANALNGQSLAGFTLPQLTNFTSWRWEKPTEPERQITAIFSYHYILESWNSYDTSE